jgi:hypothetical protein
LRNNQLIIYVTDAAEGLKTAEYPNLVLTAFPKNDTFLASRPFVTGIVVASVNDGEGIHAPLNAANSTELQSGRNAIGIASFFC